MNSISRLHLLCSIYITLISTTVFPQSIAVLLDQYEKTVQKDIEGTEEFSFSGVALNRTSGTLFVVDDCGRYIYEISNEGSLIRTIKCNGFEDLEGISFYKDNSFFITEERKANICRIDIPPTGSARIDHDNCILFNIPIQHGNQGLEGVAYEPFRNTLFAVKELGPPMIFHIALNSDGEPESVTENRPFSITEMEGDAADVFALPDSNILICNQIENKLIGFNSAGEILSELSLDMNQPEGITIDPNDSTLYLVGEPNQFAIFKKPSTTTVSTNATENSVAFSSCIVNNTNLSVSLIFRKVKHVHITLFKLNGTVLHTIDAGTFSPGQYYLTYKTPHIAPGVYYIALFTRSARQVTQLIVS